MTDKEIRFIQDHIDDDLDRLLLSAHRWKTIDVPWCVDQIAARRQLRDKVPEWYAEPALIMSGRVPAEQCSSQITAQIKQSLCYGSSICDLTGGMGVDLWYMSRDMERAIYVERNAELCQRTEHNFQTLLSKADPSDPEQCRHFEFVNKDCRDFLADPSWQVDTIYIDPSRRASDGSRVYDLADCEPNVVELLPLIMSHCQNLIVKVSPMIDITRAQQLLPRVTLVGVLAVHNECKEVCLVLAKLSEQPKEPKIYCFDYGTNGFLHFDFFMHDEQEAEVSYAEPMRYLYVPDVTLLKAGAFKMPAAAFYMHKLDVNTHLYTSDILHSDFPGRIFEVQEAQPFSSRLSKDLKKADLQANVAVRNFPLKAEELKRKLGVRDGGETYIFGATVRGKGPMLILARKVALLVSLLLLLLWPTQAFARREAPVPTIEELCASISEPVPSQWLQGKMFVATISDLGVVLRPEVPLLDTARQDWKGSFWRFNSIVMEENWLGQPQVYLQFLSPQGVKYRYETGRDERALTDTTWHPQIPGLCPLSVVSAVDSLLRGRTFYIKVDDERILPVDSLSAEAPTRKFCPVLIDSVTYGTDEAPLCVWFSREGFRFRFLAGLIGSTTASPLDKYLLTADPRSDYPDITDAHWELICQHRLEMGMTAEEVQLSWGRPYRYERTVTTAGPTEVWHYSSGARLLVLNGYLHATGF